MGVVVRQKKTGRGEPWWVFVYQYGRIKSKKVGDRKAAEVLASAIRRKIKLGELSIEDPAKQNKLPGFAEYARDFLENYARVTCKFNTVTSYTNIIENHLIPVWKGKRLDEITRADVKTLLLRKQQEGLSPKSVRNIMVLVSGIFTHAYEDQIMTSNPALRLGRFIQKTDRRKDVRPLTREQVTAFLAKTKEVYPEHYAIFLCAFRTGMRMGELLGLAWEDLHFDRNTIEVRRSYSHGQWSTPKSNKSRTIDMSNQLRDTLLALRSQLTQRFKRGLPSITVSNGSKIHLVFPARGGGPIDGDNLRHRVFYELLELVDIPKIRFHDIRHTFASLLLQNGEPLNYVKEQMGHASITTTVDVYGHLVPGANRNAVNRLDDEPTPNLKVVPANVG